MQMTPPSRQLLNTVEAAEYLGMQRTTLETWRSTKRVPLPYIKIGQHTVRYRLSDLDAFLEARTVRECEPIDD